MNDVANDLISRVKQYNLLNVGDRILVAVSGGPDSVSLLYLLHDLRQELDLHLEVAHLQHGIRGEESKEDARFVDLLAKKLGLVLHLREIDLPALLSRAGKGNLEGLARAERYRYFAEIAQRQTLNKIATGHTEDDQAETMLMWLLRGAGRKGLGGMSPAYSFNGPDVESNKRPQIIRPLLEISKAEILDYLHERQIDYRVDATNRDTKLLRNWIRLELLPQLRDRIDSGIAARLAAQAAMLRDEQAVLEQLANAELAKCQQKDALDRVELLQRPPALQRLILRIWLEQNRGNLRGIDFAHIESLRRLAMTGPAQGRFALPGGWELRRQYNSLYLAKTQRGVKPICYSRTLTLGETLQIPEADVEVVSTIISGPVSSPVADMTEACFDCEALTQPLVVRNFRRGDRFEPLGMSGHKKVKDLFIDRKVVLPERAIAPLLVAGDEIVWIPGHGRSRTALMTPQSRAVARIKVIPLGT